MKTSEVIHVDMIGQTVSVGDTVLFPDRGMELKLGRVERLMPVMAEISNLNSKKNMVEIKRRKKDLFVVTNNRSVVMYLLKK
jgi:hypothetical protein